MGEIYCHFFLSHRYADLSHASLLLYLGGMAFGREGIAGQDALAASRGGAFYRAHPRMPHDLAVLYIAQRIESKKINKKECRFKNTGIFLKTTIVS